MELADPAELAAVAGPHRRGAARVQERPGLGLRAPFDPGHAEQCLEQRPYGVEVGGTRRGAPSARRRLGHQHGQVERLGGGQRAARRALGRRLERAGGPVDVRGLEQRHAGAAVRGVVARGVEQPGQQQRTHHAVVLAERVVDPQHGLVAEAQPAAGPPAT